MGNIHGGFQMPPIGYLRELREETKSIRARSITSSHRIKGAKNNITTPYTAGQREETNKYTVKEYIIGNPDFLDDFVKTRVSLSRIRSWLRLSEIGAKLRPSDKTFATELAERSFRERKALVTTRNHLSYPIPFDREELKRLLIADPNTKGEFSEVNSYLFPYTEIAIESINRVFINMVMQLFGKYAFPHTELCYFLSSLKTNYLNVEYHNYSHALSHAQSMFWMLKRNPGIFSENEMKALMISSIAHDAGHLGVNEKYMKEVGNGLEKMYHSPVLEHHHIQVCFLILADINCNVFSDLSAEDYKKVLECIRHAIRSTDVNRYKIQVQVMRQSLGKEAKHALISLMMMACDLCAAWKRWPEHKMTVWSLYKEFFNQGEKEMRYGFDSPPQMMRENSENIPRYQVTFLEHIVLPIFELVVKIFPNCRPILKQTSDNCDLWKTYQAS